MVDKTYNKCLRIAYEECIFSAFIQVGAILCTKDDKEKISNLYYFLKKQELINNEQILTEVIEEFDSSIVVAEEFNNKTLIRFLSNIDFEIKNYQFLTNNLLEHLNAKNLIIKNED